MVFTKSKKFSELFTNDTIKNLNTSLNYSGYTLLKDELTAQQIQFLKSELIMKPITIPGYDYNVKKYELYLENEKKLYLPKAFGIHYFGLPKKNKLSDGNDINLTFTGTLRPLQEQVVNTYLDCQEKQNNKALLSIATGLGKTVISCAIITKIAKKTLIVVHQTFLINQWIERINQFIPDAKIGIIKQSKKQIEGNDIVIASLQSLAMKDYDIEEFKCFGLVIIDEIHASSGEIFKNMYYMVNFKHCLGLSATMKRKDGLEKVYYYFFGNVAYHKELEEDNDIQVHIHEYNSNDEAYCKEYTLYGGKPNLALMMTNVTCFKPRCQMIIQIIKNVFKEDKEHQRKILLLSDRREHLSILYEMFNETIKKKTVGYYVGGMKQKELDKSSTCDLILATSKLAATGLDISGLNTLILACPITSITQAIGRILRVPKENRIIQPLIIDISDQMSAFRNQSKKRITYYKKNKYSIKVMNSIDYIHIKNSNNSIIDLQDKVNMDHFDSLLYTMTTSNNHSNNNSNLTNYQIIDLQ